MFKRPIEKFIPLDQDEQKHRLELERTYRDRAEERRRGETEFQEYGDKVVIEDSAIQLRGLDLDLLKQQQLEIEKKEKEMSKLRSIMQGGLIKEATKVKEVTHHKIGPLALKIQSFLNQKEQVSSIKNQRTYYVYDMHPCFALKQPDIVTKKFEEVDAQQQQIFPILSEEVYDLFLRVYESTQQLTLARTQRPIIPNPVAQSDSDDIFEDVKPKINIPIEVEEVQDASESGEQDEQGFDPREYVKQLEAEEDMLNEEYNEKYKEKLEIEEKQRLEKLKRQQKMLQEDEDYYVECFQPTNNVQVDPDEAIVDKKGAKKGQAKFAKGKPKKKRENFDKQFEQIEEILKKKRG